MKLGVASVLYSLALTPSAHAAEWSLGFEPAEGFEANEAPGTPEIGVLGGSATVLSGGAAQGSQFLRFIPSAADNGLVLNVGKEVADTPEKTITFAVRLSGDPQRSRLVITYGQTVALRPVFGGVDIEIDGERMHHVVVNSADGHWLWIGVRESASAGAWDLLVGGRPALTGLRPQDSSALPSDVLIFADGTLDLDAVHVVSLPVPTENEETKQETEVPGLADGPPSDPAPSNSVEVEIRLIAQAHDAAARGEDGLVDARLTASEGLAPGQEVSVLLARRAAAVCGWLRNENHYGAAIKLASRTIARLAALKEARDADRAERLYWEAILQSDVLDNKRAAFALLQEAGKLAPEDERIAASELQLAQALAEFGR